MFDGRPTKASKRAKVMFSACDHAKKLLVDNGIAVDEVQRVESAGSSDSGREEILFSSVDGTPKTAMLAGSLDSDEGVLEVVDGWS